MSLCYIHYRGTVSESYHTKELKLPHILLRPSTSASWATWKCIQSY